MSVAGLTRVAVAIYSVARMFRHSLSTTVVVVTLLACGRTAPEPPPGRAADAAVARAEAPPPAPLPARPAPKRLVAIGDLHGDLAATRAALRLAGAVDAQDRWSGGDLTVVQLGDVVDRGDDERAILDWFERLQREAVAAGGAFLPLNGNHELMMALGDFRYVTPGGWAAFADVPVPPALAAKLDAAGVRAEARGRIAAFVPGGPYARQLAAHDVIAQVGDTLFVHGGVLPAHVTYGLGRINAEVSRWLAGEGPEPTAITQSDDSPVWTRAWAVAEPECAVLRGMLAPLSARRLVVGHTTQKDGVRSACDGALWFVDVGLAKFYGGPLQVLELRWEGSTSTARVLEGERPEPPGRSF
jgi:hypothetical protein